MGAKVSITTVSLGDGMEYHWRGAPSRAPRYPENAIRVEFGVHNVRGNDEAAGKVVVEALQTLIRRGRITRYSINLLPSMPKVILQASDEDTSEGAKSREEVSDIIRAIRASRTALNPFALGLADELRQLLDEIGGAKN